MANLLGTTVNGSVLVGPSGTANAYDGAATGKLYFGNQVSDSPTHYHITTNMENFGGSYSKLDIRWYTGQRFYAHYAYGGFRFKEITTGNDLFSIGEGDVHVRVENNLYIAGNLAIHAGNIGSQSVSFATTSDTFSTGRTNYKGVTENAVSGQLMWKNYGNNHTIFDASNSTSPTGSAVNNTNSDIAWTGTYPTLMGWNGNSTYGVRVDSARIADSISGQANSATITAATAATINTIALRDASGDLTVRELVMNVAVQNFTPSSMVAIYPTTNQAVKVDASGARAFLNVPTKTGGDASGTWGISITGNANTATSAGDSTNLGGRSSSRYLYYRGYSTSGDFQTLQSTESIIRFDQVGVIDSWSNAPAGVYTYGGVLSLRGDNFGLQIYGSHTGDLVFKTQWNNDQYSGWRNIIHSGNIGSQSVSYATTAGSAPANGGNSSTVAGLSVHSGRNNEADKIVRTDSSGYIQAGWINTTSGNEGNGTPDKFYGSNDNYIRYYTRAYTQMYLGNTYHYTTARRQHTTDTNYWVGTMGWGQTDWNTVGQWGSGFVDSWSNPGNKPPSGGHHVGVQAFHYRDGSTAYGWQMAQGEGTDWYLRRIWGVSWSGWYTMITSDNIASQSVSNSATTSQRDFSGDISTSGMGRFAGWYTGNAATGLAAEIGISAGQAYIIAYNRQSGAYGTLNIESSGANLRISGSTINASSGTLQQGGNAVIHAGNIGSQSVSYATSAGTAGSAGSVDGLTINNSGAPINPDNVTQNQIGYNTSVSLFGQTDGGLYSSAYSSSWIHQIYGDFRSGQIAIRGKNSGTWGDWRLVVDDKNIGTYAVPYGNMTSSTGLNDNKLYLRTNGDNNHYLWNAADDWEELVYYNGTGFRVKGATGTVSATFTDSGISIGTSSTLIRSFDAQGYLRIYGSSTNYLGIGPYNNNGWVYFENSGNSTGIYFNSPGRYAFDSVDVTPYNDNENSLGSGSYRWANIYTGGWLRNYGAQGMYNESYGTHFYSNSAEGFVVTGSGGVVQLQFRSNHQSTLRGYVYADTSNNIGFLNNGGDWSLRTDSSRNSFIYGTDLTINAAGAASSNIIMNDGDEGSRIIHCNSNRIGFLNQASSWGSYCNDNGSWESDVAMYAPIFYDTADTGYYLDPNATSNLNNVNAINFRPSNAIYFGGGNNYFNWTNSRIYSNVGIESASAIYSPQFRLTNSANNAYITGNSEWGMRMVNDNGYIQFGPANGSWSHIYSDKSFYFNQELYVNGTQVVKNSGTWGISVTGSAASSGRSSSLDIVGYGDGNMTYYQSSGTFAGYSGWAGYFVSNHGNGSNYYNQTIITPFWSPPQYSRLQGGTFVGPYTFWSTENLNDYAPNMNQYVRTTDNVTFNTTTSPTILVNGHSDNTKGYRIHNTSGSSVSAMFTNSSNQLVIAAGAVDQINLNKKVYVNAVALGVNFAPSATAGRIDASNDIVAFNSSDERLKENITPIANALDKVKSLTGVEFDWKPEHKEAHGHEGRDTGIIAQQVLAVMPTAVRTNDTGYLAVRYEKLIGLLIEANKELAARVEELEKKLG